MNRKKISNFNSNFYLILVVGQYVSQIFGDRSTCLLDFPSENEMLLRVLFAVTNR